jgi:hypothetical protein
MPSVSSKGSKGRGFSFSDNEISSMLDLIEERSPIGPQEWDVIEAIHNVRFPDMNRTKETIKRKYTMLYSAKSPTGDPNCPPNVRRAKRIYHQIKEKTDLVAEDDDDVSIESVREGEDAPNNAGRDDDTSTINNSSTTTIRSTTPVVPQFDGEMQPPKTVSSGGPLSFRAPVQRVGSKRTSMQSDDNMMMDRYFQYMMTQRQMEREDMKAQREQDREDERLRRENDRKEEEMRRREERERREEERERHMNLMQMMMFGIVRPQVQPMNSPIANPIFQNDTPIHSIDTNDTPKKNNTSTPTNTDPNVSQKNDN